MMKSTVRLLDVTSLPELELPAMLPVFDGRENLIGDATNLRVEEVAGRKYVVGDLDVTKMPDRGQAE